MSFLYKALLKNNQADPEQASPTPAQFDTASSQLPPNQNPAIAPFATAGEKSSVPIGMWLALGGCLLVIGLLAGYLFGQQGANAVQVLGQNQQAASQTTPVQTTTVEEPVMSEQQNQPQTVGSYQTDMVFTKQPNDGVVGTQEASKTAQLPSTTARVAQVNSEANGGSSDSSVNVTDSQTSQPIEQVTTEPAPQPQSDQVVSYEVEGQPITRMLPDEAELQAIPEALKDQFAMAVQQTADFQAEQGEPAVSTASTLLDINELPLTDKAGLPDMVYQMHIYASEPSERWIQLNDQRLYEGEQLTKGLVLREIRQNSIIWETAYTRFQQEALTDYHK